ncbi:methylated-DNA--[protein]-cysteine S-methyltransferase [Mycetocola tolaasinivorans]|uniref:methylated-DNA--[protein]-cysteine S-methyltransferase n=1 Tax=Mycetocola tolaasinivorans TaxID=76635 RepID=A0A3L7ADY7_9MICO|nr:methylated-DNA--[protein]-cysteine S-methyltransferase [Mycetocola tolaasinivorans]RLP78020.1 methylated-DNA--[protein]-cysteine S-methyltransferase [Mycetocola tolaasinivorans]
MRRTSATTRPRFIAEPDPPRQAPVLVPISQPVPGPVSAPGIDAREPRLRSRDSLLLHQLIRDQRFRSRYHSQLAAAGPEGRAVLDEPSGVLSTQAPAAAPGSPEEAKSREHRVRERGFDSADGEPRALDLDEATVDSPWGPLILLASPDGLLRVRFGDHPSRGSLSRVPESPPVRPVPDLDELTRGFQRAPTQSSAHLRAACDQLREYIEHSRERFELALDLAPIGAYHRAVLAKLSHIRYGHTISFSELAAAAGRPRAARAAGAACARNPLPIVLACHRVILSDGTLGGHVAGPDIKHALLTHEGVFGK